mmetsp:Transcript_1457/g.3919  ORF Transcript_1457/g.3919 Transcript_1457/m.3919 type:complete len:116 (+) Transcript_1457:178-525(+)
MSGLTNGVVTSVLVFVGALGWILAVFAAAGFDSLDGAFRYLQFWYLLVSWDGLSSRVLHRVLLTVRRTSVRTILWMRSDVSLGCLFSQTGGGDVSSGICWCFGMDHDCLRGGRWF